MGLKIERLKNGAALLMTRRAAHFTFLCIIILIFIVFFTSRLWMPPDDDIVETPVGTTFQIASATAITLKGWNMTPDGDMLVDVGISDISVNKEFGYSVGAYDASGRALTHDVVFSGTDFVLLRVRGAAKQKVVHIGVQVQEIGKAGKPTNARPTTHRFSALTENVGTNVDLPTEYIEQECILLDMRCDLELLKSDERQQEETIQENRDVIATAKMKIESLKEKQQMQTPDEITDSNSQITQLQGTVAAAEKEIAKLEEDLFNIANQLESKTAKIEEYRAAHGL